MSPFFTPYASFAFALSFAFHRAVPWVFVRERGWGTILGNLPFLGMFVGTMVSIPVKVANSPRYARGVAENNGKSAPEAPLPPLAVGAVSFVIGLLWYAWTSTCQCAIPVVGSAFTGAAIGTMYIECINYLVDTYGVAAASAVSAKTIIRSLLAGGLPLATRPMLQNLGVGPGISIYGGIAALLLPVPLVLMQHGKDLRSIIWMATKLEVTV